LPLLRAIALLNAFFKKKEKEKENNQLKLAARHRPLERLFEKKEKKKNNQLKLRARALL